MNKTDISKCAGAVSILAQRVPFSGAQVGRGLLTLSLILPIPLTCGCSSTGSNLPGPGAATAGAPAGAAGTSGSSAGGSDGSTASGGTSGDSGTIAGGGATSGGAASGGAASGGSAGIADGAAGISAGGAAGSFAGAGGGSAGLPPDFGMGESNSGPGGPTKPFVTSDLFKHCASLDGGPGDKLDQHDIVSMYDGYLVMPWSPEQGTGGISFYDVSDACAPTQVGYGYSDEMRETHSVAISNRAGGHWMAVDMIRTATVNGVRAGGVQIWDISDIKNPKAVSTVDVPGHNYPDAYKRVVLTEWWQGKYVYAGGGLNGVWVVDVSDPLKPTIAKQINIQPAMPVFGVIAIGNLLAIASSEQSRVVLMDISDPINPKPIPGGDFNTQSAARVNTNSYMFNVVGGFGYFGRQSGGGGFMMYDLHDPSNPKLVADYPDKTVIASNSSHGVNGAYVFRKDQFVFAGNSNNGGVYDVSDPSKIKTVNHGVMQGDNDWITPIGNVVFMSVDENAITNQATVVLPWTENVDTTPPTATWSYPSDGAKNLRLTSRIGVSFTESIDVKSAWKAGHVMLYETALGQSSRVATEINVQDTIVNVSPSAPLKPNTSYTLEIPAGGLEDFNANKLQTGFKIAITTGAT
jgi:hypothetical protein